MKHPLVKLALEAIGHYLRTGGTITPPAPIPGETDMKAGVFVSLKKHGALRGCIGTVKPAQRNILEETIHNAISAAACDPRFPPVREDELPDIKCSVDVLSEPESVPDVSELDPGKYGVIVESGFKRGLLLPRLEGVDTVNDQILIAKQKAGIKPDGPCEIYRFTVNRYF